MEFPADMGERLATLVLHCRLRPLSRATTKGIRRSGSVCEHFDDSATPDLAVVAFADHTHELGSKFKQTINPAFDGSELVGGYLAYSLAGRLRYPLKGEHRLDRRNVKTKLARMADERQSPNVVRIIEASSAFSPRRRGYQVDPLIVANCLDINACAPGYGSDSEHLGLIL